MNRFHLVRGAVSISQILEYKVDGGAERDRTADLYNAIVALSQLSYSPILTIGRHQTDDRRISCGTRYLCWVATRRLVSGLLASAFEEGGKLGFSPSPFKHKHALEISLT